MRNYLVFILLVFGIMVSSVSAQSEFCTRDSFFPESGNCGYDVSDYLLDMTWDAGEDLWDVIEDLTFTAEWDTDELHFDFTDSYEIYGLTIDGVAVDFDLKEQDLTIYYNFTHDTEYHLYAGFRGKLNYGFIFDENGKRREENSGFCMLNEPTNAWRYYVCNDHPKDKATYHYSFTVPADYTPAGVGRLLEIREADGTVIHPEGIFTREAGPKGMDGTVTFTYAAAEPMAPYLFAVCAFPYDLRQKTLDNGVVELDFVDPELSDLYDLAWELAGQQESIIQMFEHYLGKYPYRDLGAIFSPTFLGAALETQTRPMYDITTLEDYIVAHELFHQWFGDLVSVEDWSDVWIKEGGATFGEYLYTLHFIGPEAFSNTLKHNYEVIASGSSHVYDLKNDYILDWLRLFLEDSGGKFDRKTSIEAAESLCRVNADGTQRPDSGMIQLPEGDTVTTEAWIDALKTSCRTIRMDHRSVMKFFEMTGEDMGISGMVDHYPGPKEITSSTDDMYGHAVYYGGSFVYYALYERLGDDLFSEAMQLLLERNAYKTINEEKFIEAFSDAAGEDLSDFIRSWLYYGEGHVPDLPGIETWEEARAK